MNTSSLTSCTGLVMINYNTFKNERTNSPSFFHRPCLFFLTSEEVCENIVFYYIIYAINYLRFISCQLLETNVLAF